VLGSGALALWGLLVLSRPSVGLALDLGAMMLVVGLCWFALGRLMDRLLLEREQQAQRLSEAMARRHKLSATLFHDVRNHLQALLLTAELGHDDGWPPKRREAMARLVERLRTFLDAARAQVLGLEEGHGALEALAVRDLHAALTELFQGRLAAKQQSLALGRGGELRCLGARDLLIGSVLANLATNAIKFSPRGARLELQADVEAGRLRLRLLDAGPGLPSSAAEALGRGGSPASTPGSEGEEGQGYGLRLAADHATGMGGRMLYLPRPDGALVAELELPLA
jgi:two-component system sensor histidine kinase KdpD